MGSDFLPIMLTVTPVGSLVPYVQVKIAEDDFLSPLYRILYSRYIVIYALTAMFACVVIRKIAF